MADQTGPRTVDAEELSRGTDLDADAAAATATDAPADAATLAATTDASADVAASAANADGGGARAATADTAAADDAGMATSAAAPAAAAPEPLQDPAEEEPDVPCLACERQCEGRACRGCGDDTNRCGCEPAFCNWCSTPEARDNVVLCERCRNNRAQGGPCVHPECPEPGIPARFCDCGPSLCYMCDRPDELALPLPRLITCRGCWVVVPPYPRCYFCRYPSEEMCGCVLRALPYQPTGPFGVCPDCFDEHSCYNCYRRSRSCTRYHREPVDPPPDGWW